MPDPMPDPMTTIPAATDGEIAEIDESALALGLLPPLPTQLIRKLLARIEQDAERAKGETEALVFAFVQGARWWEWTDKGETMWQSDQERAWKAARERLEAGTLGVDILAALTAPTGEGVMLDLEEIENGPHAVWCNQFDPTKSAMCSCHKKFVAPLIAELRLARDVVEAARIAAGPPEPPELWEWQEFYKALALYDKGVGG